MDGAESLARLMGRVMGWLVVVAVAKAAWVWGLHPWLANQVTAALSPIGAGGMSGVAWILHPAGAFRSLVQSALAQFP